MTALLLTLATLNLHGLHPMGELPRYTQNLQGKIETGETLIDAFTNEELERGNSLRLNQLAQDLRKSNLDIILFQEVGAGFANALNCATFYNKYPIENMAENTVFRLEKMLREQDYSAHVACRGNIGWRTSDSSSNWHRYIDHRILINDPIWGFKTVFDIGADPYPNGIIVEGFGALVKKPWVVKENKLETFTYNPSVTGIQNSATELKAQWLELSYVKENNKKNVNITQFPWILVINIHGGHKMVHLEQSIAVREKVYKYLDSKAENEKQNLLGVVFAGDFNAYMHRTNVQNIDTEVFSFPWEFRLSGNYDALDALVTGQTSELYSDIVNQASSQTYKKWASISKTEAAIRAQKALSTLKRFVSGKVEKPENPLVMQDALTHARLENLCPWNILPDIACNRAEHIDHIIFGGKLKLESSSIFYSSNNWFRTDTLSDHPGVAAKFSWAEN